MENKETNRAKISGGASLREHQNALMTLLCEFDRVCRELDIRYVLYSGTMLGAVRHKGFIPWDDDLDILMMREDYERFLNEANTLLDTEKFYLQKEFSEHWPMFFSKLRLNKTTCLEKYHPRDPMMHQGVYIDIFPCDNARATSLGRKMQFCASKVVIAKALTKRGYETESAKKKLFMALCKVLPNTPFLKISKTGRANSGYLHSFFAAASNFEKNVYKKELFDGIITAEFEGGLYPIPERYDELLKKLYGDYMTLPSEEEKKIKQHAIFVDLNRDYSEYRELHREMIFDIHTRSIR